MIATERMISNPYAYDKDYDAFHGRVVAKYVKKLGITEDGYVIGRVTRVIDLGRREPITPRDPDEQMRNEELPYTAGIQGNPGIQGETVHFMRRICKLLSNGPMSMAEIVEATGAGCKRIGALFEKYAKSFGITCKRGVADKRKWYWQLEDAA